MGIFAVLLEPAIAALEAVVTGIVPAVVPAVVGASVTSAFDQVSPLVVLHLRTAGREPI